MILYKNETEKQMKNFSYRVAVTVALITCLVTTGSGQNSDPLWFPVGPAPEGQSTLQTNGGVSGRIWSIAFSKNFDQKGTAAMYIGAAGGGVWRSIDYTSLTPHWTPLLDHFPTSFPISRLLGLQDIGAVAVDPNHPWIIYAGSGDPAGPGPNGYGQGILKSTDGGSSWSLSSLTLNPFAPGFSRIIVDPTDPSGNTVYSNGGFGPNSPLRGIFKSVDGGTSWNLIHNGLPTKIAVSDLDFAIINNQIILFAGIQDLSGQQGDKNGIWQSPDKGETWTQMTISAMTDLSGLSIPNASIGLIRLAVDHTPGAANGLYAGLVNASKSEMLNIFKLKNNAWSPIGHGFNGIISTAGAFAMGLSESGQIFAGMGNASQDGIYQSSDQGTTWTNIFSGTDGFHPHHDQRSWGFSNGQVFEGNDGGLNRFVIDSKGTGIWQSLNTPSLQTIMAQGISSHPLYPNVILTGSQDNGVALRRNGIWQYVTGDDDASCKFDPFDADYTYRTSVSEYSFFFRSKDGGLTWPDDISVPGKPNVPYYASYAFHPTVPGRIVVGLDKIYETRTRGDQWSAISDLLGGTGATAGTVAYAGGDVIYASYGSRLFKTVNDGASASNSSWSELQSPTGSFQGAIVSIVFDPSNANNLFLGILGGIIWNSSNGGSTWTNVTSDFPSNLQLNRLAIRYDESVSHPVIYLASSVGVYSSFMQGNSLHWKKFGQQMPDVNVTDLQYNPTNKYLIASTFGRGVFAAYTHFSTNAPVGSTTLNNRIYTVARDLDGRVCINQATFGSAFSGWFEVQGHGNTPSAPAAVSVNNNIFIFIRDAGNRILLNQAEFQHPFGEWFEVQGNGITDAAPAAAAIGKTVYVFVKGIDGKIYKNEADFGHAFGNWFPIPGNITTNVSPWVVTHNNTLYVFIRGTDGKIYKNEADIGHAFGDWFPIPGTITTDVSPTAAVIGNTLYVIIKSTQGQVYKTEADFGHSFGDWFEVTGAGQTNVPLSACSLPNELFIFMKALDGTIDLNQAAFRQGFSGWFEVGGGIQQ